MARPCQLLRTMWRAIRFGISCTICEPFRPLPSVKGSGTGCFQTNGFGTKFFSRRSFAIGRETDGGSKNMKQPMYWLAAIAFLGSVGGAQNAAPQSAYQAETVANGGAITG